MKMHMYVNDIFVLNRTALSICVFSNTKTKEREVLFDIGQVRNGCFAQTVRARFHSYHKSIYNKWIVGPFIYNKWTVIRYLCFIFSVKKIMYIYSTIHCVI